MVATAPVSEAPATPPAGVAARPSNSGGRYVLGAEIGRGGMGRVVVGTDTRLGREVAIKEALPQGADLERFEREVRITARLEHPSIVPLYDAGITPTGQPFYVMRKVSGRPLERLIAERTGQDAGTGPGREAPGARGSGMRGSIDERLALLPHVLAAAHAVGHAHRRGVIHRDVKPANILIGELGETVVIDWGLAKVIGEDEASPPPPPVDAAIAPSGEVATQAGAVFGTPGFMAPEQARGEAIDTRSDVYALGATLYHVLAGHPPPNEGLADVIARAREAHRADAALATLPLPPELVAIAGKAMQFDPVDRYPDGAAFADDLNRFLAGRLVAAHHYTPAERLRRFVFRYRAVVTVAACSAIVVATGGVLAIRGIVVERERAQNAEQAAIAGRHDAELARDREADRADDAVILKAQAELARDPTAAVATLATLRPESRRWAQARPIAIEARLRGIAHVYRGDGWVGALALGPDRRSLLAVGATTGTVSIIDLLHNRERALATCPGPCRGAWGDGGATVWLAPQAGGLYPVAVATGAQGAPALTDKLDILYADPAATYLAFAIHGRGAGILDASGVHYVPHLTSAVTNVRIAPNGAWAAFASTQELVVVDRGGRELARETGALQSATLTAAGSGKQLAILTADATVLEIDLPGGLADGRASTSRITPAWRVYWLEYVNDTLYVNLRSATEMRPLHDPDNRGAELARVSWSQKTWQDHTAIGADGLRLLGPAASVVLWSPIHDPTLEIAGRHDSRYLAVHTRGAIATWDLGDVLPRPVARNVVDAWAFDDQTALINDLVTHEWLDLETGARTPIEMPRGFVKWHYGDPATGRQVILLARENEPDIAVVAHRGRSEVTPVDVPGLRCIDVSGPDLIAGTAAGDLLLLAGGAPPRTLHHFDAPVDVAIANGTWIVGQAKSGMLARYGRATGTLDTTRPPFEVTYMTLAPNGDVYLTAKRQLYRWRGHSVEPIATLPSAITATHNIQDREAVVAITEQGTVYTIAPDHPEAERVTQLFFRAATAPRGDGVGRYMAVETFNSETTVLDLTRGTRWQLPTPDHVNAISPSGRIALLLTNGQLSVIHIDVPDDPAQLRAWIVQATNYTPDATGP